MNLEEIRRKIDSVDGDIITLLSQRAGLVSEAGKLKKDLHAVKDPKRVEQVLAKVKVKAFYAGLDPAIAEEVYRTIIGCFVDKEHAEFKQKNSRQ